ncbi:hypothetical protein M501DRAFT_988248 [Patellaria atrata CBS 101060]|uniref:Uncharacterized protein n=1 Tax=Patellaria atrata CBS 101060 TaxID=1346257 RepID=A0A9P4VUH4_9PEZI|nr:hypothetical protein M501DRAFT_988248 [Patellaria atrata CBS 101060]
MVFWKVAPVQWKVVADMTTFSMTGALTDQSNRQLSRELELYKPPHATFGNNSTTSQERHEDGKLTILAAPSYDHETTTIPTDEPSSEDLEGYSQVIEEMEYGIEDQSEGDYENTVETAHGRFDSMVVRTRPHGMRLATIIEQTSSATLASKASSNQRRITPIANPHVRVYVTPSANQSQETSLTPARMEEGVLRNQHMGESSEINEVERSPVPVVHAQRVTSSSAASLRSDKSHPFLSAPTSRRSREDSTRYTQDGIPIYRSDAPSEYSGSRVSSWGSYNSALYTSAVSTVRTTLGGPRIRVPSNVSSQGALPSLPKYHPPTLTQAELRIHTVNSPALEALLPIAAANGIITCTEYIPAPRSPPNQPRVRERSHRLSRTRSRSPTRDTPLPTKTTNRELSGDSGYASQSEKQRFRCRSDPLAIFPVQPRYPVRRPNSLPLPLFPLPPGTDTWKGLQMLSLKTEDVVLRRACREDKRGGQPEKGVDRRSRMTMGKVLRKIFCQPIDD